MPANTAPIFTGTPIVGTATWLPATTANTKSDGSGTIGTDMLLIRTSGTNGDFWNRVRCSPVASTASTATTASVIRLYLSTQSSGATTNANTRLLAEASAVTQTVDAATAGIYTFDIPLGFAVPTGQNLLVSMHHAAAASTAWQFILFGGTY